MTRSQREWWNKLRAYAEETVRLFSEDGRTTREKMVVAEFLRHLGIEFTDDELTMPATDDDVDVHFRTARSRTPSG